MLILYTRCGIGANSIYEGSIDANTIYQVWYRC